MPPKPISAAARGINEHVAMGPSPWAQRMLEKQGWNQGKGLGKKEDGMVTHVRVAKKEDNAALGFKEAAAAKSNDQWFFGDPFATARVGGRAAVAAEADSSASEGSSSEGEGAGSSRGKKRGREQQQQQQPSRAAAVDQLDAAAFPGAPQGEDVQAFYQKLFKATGGARLGMRARRDQPGKWDRAEVAKQAAAAAAEEEEGGEAGARGSKAGRRAAKQAEGAAAAQAAAAEGGEAEEASAKAARKAARRAQKEEARLLEEKAARKARRKAERAAEED